MQKKPISLFKKSHSTELPIEFKFGAVMMTFGVMLHLPLYIEARGTGFHMAGMAMDAPMRIGMMLLVIGLLASVAGLFSGRMLVKASKLVQLQGRALDDAPIRSAHIGLIVVMALAVTIDVMKPTALAFVMPGMALEYGLRSPLNPMGDVPVVLLPLCGIAGTVVGSVLWGWLGDRVGRRASILFAGILFIGTSNCGAMPDYRWNFAMCFAMGLGVGGMLPVIYALIAETIPARHRGWLMVLIGSDVAAAYILTSWAATLLVPVFSWRILWLLGLPSGVLLIFLNEFIPESPRYLLAVGREAEARAIMHHFGAALVDGDVQSRAEGKTRSRWTEMLRGPLLSQTAVVVVLGLALGLVLFGFNLWIPSNLRALGFQEVTADSILRDSALIGLPLTFLVAFMYGFWSSKKTMILLSALTAAGLFGFMILGDSTTGNRALLYALLVWPIWGVNAVTALLFVYSSEIYPTHVRSRGTGLAAAASKAGGVMMLALVALGAAAPSILVTTFVGGVSMVLAAVAILLCGIETRNKPLEDLVTRKFAADRTEAVAG